MSYVLSRHGSLWVQRTVRGRQAPCFPACCCHLSFSRVVCKTNFVSAGGFLYFFLQKYKDHRVLFHSISSKVTSAECCINTGALTGCIRCVVQCAPWAAQGPVALYWFCPSCTEDWIVQGNKTCFMKLQLYKLITLPLSKTFWKPPAE